MKPSAIAPSLSASPRRSERQLQRLLGALHERGAVSLRAVAALCRQAAKQSAMAWVRIAPPSTVSAAVAAPGNERGAASLRAAASSGQAANSSLWAAMAPLRVHCPAALGERQPQRLLGALHVQRGACDRAVSLRAAAFRWPGCNEAFGDGAFLCALPLGSS
jgi:hypothetical protein